MKSAGGATGSKHQNASPDDEARQNAPKTPLKPLNMHLRFWITAAAALLVDLLTKALAWKHLGPPAEGNPPRHIVPGWLTLTTTENYGAVFGVGQGLTWFFVFMSIAAAGLMLWLLLSSQPRQRMFHLGLGLILGGTLGNLFDRICFGHVRDFILFTGKAQIGGFQLAWPYVFNLADVFLVIGVVGAIIAWLAGPKGMPGSDRN